MPKRNLDGTFRNNNQIAQISKRTLHARWLESEVMRLRLAGVYSLAAVAAIITRVGRGEQRPLTQIPVGLSFPANYSITAQSCKKACDRALKSEAKLNAHALRELNLQRLGNFLLALQPRIQSGDLKAIAIAVRIVEVEASLCGLKNSPPEQDVPIDKQRNEKQPGPNGAIIDLFREAHQVLIECGAVTRLYGDEPIFKSIETNPQRIEAAGYKKIEGEHENSR